MARQSCFRHGRPSGIQGRIDEGRYDGWQHWRALLGGPLLWLGVAAFVGEFFLWLALLTLVPLAQGVLIGSASIVSVMIGGRLFFGEAITAPRAVAALLIATGVALVGWGGA